MSSVGQRDTRPELLVRTFLHRSGLRFRVAGRPVPGTPDIVLRKWRVVIFVHGCFWHAHQDCRYHTVPKTRTEFWLAKFSANRERDQRTLADLKTAGWRCAVVWECALKKPFLENTLKELYEFILDDASFCQLSANGTAGLDQSKESKSLREGDSLGR